MENRGRFDRDYRMPENINNNKGVNNKVASIVRPPRLTPSPLMGSSATPPPGKEFRFMFATVSTVLLLGLSGCGGPNEQVGLCTYLLGCGSDKTTTDPGMPHYYGDFNIYGDDTDGTDDSTEENSGDMGAGGGEVEQ